MDGDSTADIETSFGNPSGSRVNGISKLMKVNFETEWTWSTGYARRKIFLTIAGIGGRSGVYISSTHITPTNCFLVYNKPSNEDTPPTVDYITPDW